MLWASQNAAMERPRSAQRARRSAQRRAATGSQPEGIVDSSDRGPSWEHTKQVYQAPWVRQHPCLRPSEKVWQLFHRTQAVSLNSDSTYGLVSSEKCLKMPRQKRVNKQYTFRCNAEMAGQLSQAAAWLHTDVNGVLTRLALRGLPLLLHEAEEAHKKYVAAQLLAPTDYLLPPDEPLLRRLIVAGRTSELPDKRASMMETAKKEFRAAQPTAKKSLHNRPLSGHV
jgi:hypothetical protein